MVFTITETVLLWQVIRTTGIFTCPFQHIQYIAWCPCRRNQALFRFRRGRRLFNQLNHWINIRQRQSKTFENMTTFTRLAQIINCASGYNFTTVLNKRIKQLLQVQSLRLPIDESDGVNTEHTLQLSLSEQVIQYDFWHFTATQFNDDTHTVFIRLVAQFGNAFDFLVFNQLGDLLDQAGFVDHVWDFGEDDGHFAVFLVFFELMTCTQINAATASAIRLNNPVTTINKCGCWEVRAWNIFHQIIDSQIRIIDQGQTAIQNFCQVMRWDIRRHTNSDTRRAIHQQVRDAGGKHFWDLFSTVVVRHPVNGFFINISQHLMADLLHPDFRVTHRRSRVTIHRTEVTLTIDQGVAHREVLSHPNNGVIHRRVTVRVVFTDHITNNTRRLFVRLIPVIAENVHSVQHAAVYRLKTIPDIRQSPPDNYAHRIIQVRLLQLVFNINWQNFFG